MRLNEVDVGVIVYLGKLVSRLLENIETEKEENFQANFLGNLKVFLKSASEDSNFESVNELQHKSDDDNDLSSDCHLNSQNCLHLRQDLELISTW